MLINYLFGSNFYHNFCIIFMVFHVEAQDCVYGTHIW
ncbi:hypothetical protein, partial [Plasmodium yoelii yoelii]